MVQTDQAATPAVSTPLPPYRSARAPAAAAARPRPRLEALARGRAPWLLACLPPCWHHPATPTPATPLRLLQTRSRRVLLPAGLPRPPTSQHLCEEVAQEEHGEDEALPAGLPPKLLAHGDDGCRDVGAVGVADGHRQRGQRHLAQHAQRGGGPAGEVAACACVCTCACVGVVWVCVGFRAAPGRHASKQARRLHLAAASTREQAHGLALLGGRHQGGGGVPTSSSHEAGWLGAGAGAPASTPSSASSSAESWDRACTRCPRARPASCM